jgi:hypothetical protein
MVTDIQRICVKAKPLRENPDYYEWQIANICMFIPENDKKLAIKKAREELSRRCWDFISYEDKSTLIEVRVMEDGGEVWEAYQYAKQGKIFFRVFTEHFGAGNKDFRPIRPIRITEKFMDSVIDNAGGCRLPIKEKADGKKNADYLLGEFILELKDLQEEGLEKELHQKKLAKIFAPYFPGKSEITIDTSILAKADYLKYLDIISRPIKSHIKSASKQIKETREVLDKPSLKGGIIFLNTGFGTFPHDEFANQVERYAQKDSNQFQTIVSISIWSYTNGLDTYVYFKFSPQGPVNKEISCLRESFNKLFEEMMTNTIRGNIAEFAQISDPLKPVSFNLNGIDFNWSPPKLPLPWVKLTE